ncbi:MAG: hypothetical protein AB8B81_05675 [Halioglobus sp.]
MKRLALRLKAKGQSCAVCSDNTADNVIKNIASDCKQLQIAYLHDQSSELNGAPEPSADKVVENFLVKSKLYEEKDLHPYRKLLQLQKSYYHQLLKSNNVRYLLICEDGPGGNAPLIYSAKACKIPVFVHPFGIGESKDYDNFIEDHHRLGSLNILDESAETTDYIRERGKHWIRASKFGDVTLFPQSMVWARLEEGLDLHSPWVVQGGGADKLFVSSAMMKKHYLREGVPIKKIVEVGSIYADEVFETLSKNANLRKAYETQSKIEAGTTSVLLTLLPNYHDVRGELCEFKDYTTLISNMLEKVNAIPGCEVSVSIHPNILEKDYAIIKTLDINIEEEWLVSALPKYDILMTQFSTTTRWAIGLKKPVINYDPYCFGLQTYSEVPGVLTDQKLDESVRKLDELVNDNDAYARIAQLQSQVAKRWATLDGQNFERIYNYINS